MKKTRIHFFKPHIKKQNMVHSGKNQDAPGTTFSRFSPTVQLLVHSNTVPRWSDANYYQRAYPSFGHILALTINFRIDSGFFYLWKFITGDDSPSFPCTGMWAFWACQGEIFEGYRRGVILRQLLQNCNHLSIQLLNWLNVITRCIQRRLVIFL